jgi:hypothetical protein
MAAPERPAFGRWIRPGLSARRWPTSTDIKKAGSEIETLATKMGGTKSGWSGVRHGAWIATCHSRDGLQGRKQQPTLRQLWAKAITKTEAWVGA